MTTLQKFLSDCRQVESKASKAPWHCGHMSELHCEEMDIDAADLTNVAEDVRDDDRAFIIHARNNFLKLVECVQVLAEACEQIKNDSSFEPWPVLVTKAIDKVEELLK